MRSTSSVLALGLVLAAASAAPSHADTGVYVGVGPRFAGSGADTSTDAVGLLRLLVEVEPMLLVAFDGYGYLTGPGTSDGTPLAGGGASLLFRPPIPGPFSAEIGAGLGLANFTPDRHGVDEVRAYWSGEVAAGLSLGPVETRLVYQRVLGSPNGALVGASVTSQLMLLLGVEL